MRKYFPNCFPKWLYNLDVWAATYEGPHFSTFLSVLVIAHVCDYSHPGWCEKIIHMVLIYIPLMMSDSIFFKYLLATSIYMIYLEVILGGNKGTTSWFYMWLSSLPSKICKGDYCLPLLFELHWSPFTCQLNTNVMFFSGLLIIFLWSICLSLVQYDIVSIL